MFSVLTIGIIGNSVFFHLGWAVITLHWPSTYCFLFTGETKVMQILILIVQIHANDMANIDMRKAKIFN